MTVGDPILSTSIGWHSGHWNWKVSSALNVPAGAYRPSQLSNLAPNHFIDDLAAAMTYLDPVLGACEAAEHVVFWTGNAA